MAARAKTKVKAKPKRRTEHKAKSARRAGAARSSGRAPRVSAGRQSGKPASGNGHERDLLTRLKDGAVICAEGYVFELERRGYLQAGAFVPEVLFEHPEVVEQLHMDFV